MPCPTCTTTTTATTVDGGSAVDTCGTCAPDTALVCPRCDDPLTDGACATCETCDRCGDAELPDEVVRTVRGSTICAGCRAAAYWQCHSCDGWNRDGNDCGNDCHSEYCDCEDCYDGDDDDDDGEIWAAEYRPDPVFHGTGPLFLGPEIEIEAPSYERAACAGVAASYLGDLGYVKADSSLDNGFEIVTHPMSYEWALAHFPWDMLTRLTELGCTDDDTTGIHVHVSRAAFASPAHVYRWMKFIYRNQHQVTTLARRVSPTFAAFTDDGRQAIKDYAKGSGCESRYQAINTQNEDTFELRIFASSLQPRQVQAALGFAAASVQYTRDLTVRQILDGGWTWPAFVDWIREHPAYAPLLAELEALACVC